MNEPIDFNENVENEYFEEIQVRQAKQATLNDQQENALSSKDWYWSKISRAQANDLLHGKKDGTFLVRDSSNINDYTLTVKKDGINKMMRILCKNNKYGFRDPCQFDSLQLLIEHHTKHSLAEFYPEMNVRLEYSLSKSDICSSLNVNSNEIDVDTLKEKFETANQEYINLTQEYDDYHRDYKLCQDDIQKFRQSLNCFEETFAIFEEQIKLNEENQKEAMAHEKDGLGKHRLSIEDKLFEIKAFRKQLEQQCDEKNEESSDLDRKINEIKPLLNEKKRNTEQIRAILINKLGKKEAEKTLEYQINDLIYSNLKPNLNKSEFSDHNQQQHDQLQNKNLNLNYCSIDIANAATYSTTINNSSAATSLPLSNLDKLHSQQQDLNLPTTSNDANSILNNCLDNSLVNNSKTVTLIANDQQNEDSAYLGLENANRIELDLIAKPLIDAEWYVGDLSKENVNTIMKNQADGTFLVRDSQNRFEAPFTLTVRVNGSTKMLRILKSVDNYYGFKPDKLEFGNVIKLIDFYRNEPLIVFKPDLIIHLKYPMTKDQIRNCFSS